MRVSVLEIAAQLENVTNLRVPHDYEYNMRFKCNNCGTDTEKIMSFSQKDKVPLMGGKTFVNLIFKCKLCSRPSNVSVVENSLRPYMAESSPGYQPFVEFDCRGCDPVEFQPVNRFQCTGSSSGTEFSDVDLTELNWADYDENAQEAVAIYNFLHRFTVIKK